MQIYVDIYQSCIAAYFNMRNHTHTRTHTRTHTQSQDQPNGYFESLSPKTVDNDMELSGSVW